MMDYNPTWSKVEVQSERFSLGNQMSQLSLVRETIITAERAALAGDNTQNWRFGSPNAHRPGLSGLFEQNSVRLIGRRLTGTKGLISAGSRIVVGLFFQELSPVRSIDRTGAKHDYNY